MFLNDSIPTVRVYPDTPLGRHLNGGVPMDGGKYEAKYTVFARRSDLIAWARAYAPDLSTNDAIAAQFQARSHMFLGGVRVYGVDILDVTDGMHSMKFIYEEQMSCSNPGEEGTLYKETKMTTLMPWPMTTSASMWSPTSTKGSGCCSPPQPSAYWSPTW